MFVELETYKERNKSLTRGHVEDIGFTVGIKFYGGQGYEGDNE
jgi:hypothetical protein